MNKKVEIATLAAGGLGLFGLCFVGFAAISGAPLEELAVIGPLFADDEQAEAEGESTEAADGGELEGPSGSEGLKLPERRGSAQEVVSANLGVLGAFALPAPFARADLEGLVDDLERERDTLVERERAVVERERAVEDQVAALDVKAAELERIKTEIEAQAAALELRSLELQRDEKVASAGEDLRYQNLATLYASGETDQAVADLVALGPDEAALVLRILDEDRALELLREMTGANRQLFIEAWARSNP